MILQKRPLFHSDVLDLRMHVIAWYLENCCPIGIVCPFLRRREMSNKALAEGLDDGHKKRSTTFRIVVEAYVRWYRFSKD